LNSWLSVVETTRSLPLLGSVVEWYVCDPFTLQAEKVTAGADPNGEFLACVGAGPVYRLLKAQDLGTDQMPDLDHPIMHTIAYHIHTGGHAITPFDWDQFLTFADRHLRVR
jgi:hypothetical protein